jgi:hypothetical protein
VIGHGLAGKDRDQMFVNSGADGRENPATSCLFVSTLLTQAPNTGIRGVTAIAI